MVQIMLICIKMARSEVQSMLHFCKSPAAIQKFHPCRQFTELLQWNIKISTRTFLSAIKQIFVHKHRCKKRL